MSDKGGNLYLKKFLIPAQNTAGNIGKNRMLHIQTKNKSHQLTSALMACQPLLVEYRIDFAGADLCIGYSRFYPETFV